MFKVRFIVNPGAGKKNAVRALTRSVVETLHDADGFFEIKSTRAKGDAVRLAKEAVDLGYTHVFACGGDGTVNEVASALVSTDAILGVVPLGSGNAFAGSLGIPFVVDEAVGLLKKGGTRLVDAGIAGGRYFFTTAGFAFEAYIARAYDSSKVARRLGGISPYAPITAYGFLRFKPLEFKLTYDGRTEGVAPFMLTIANTEQIGAGAIIAPGALFDDGSLDLCIVPRIGAIKALKLGAKLFSGKLDTSAHLRRYRVERLDIECEGQEILGHVDGEPFTSHSPISIGVLHKKLKVLLPS